MALQAATCGSGRETLDLAEAAQRAARPVATPKLSSLLAAREALASARQADGRRCRAALATAERFLAEGDDAEGLDWLAAWGSASIHEAAARVHLFLGTLDVAAQAARTALESVGSAHPRNEALYLTSLAQALVAQGGVDEGAAVAIDAVSRLDALSSARVHERLQALSGASGAPHGRHRSQGLPRPAGSDLAQG